MTTPTAQGPTAMNTDPQVFRPTPDALDGINLERALVDFEIANARVIDLTRRLVELNKELTTLRAEQARGDLELARVRADAEIGERELKQTAGHLAELRGSKAYRAAKALGDLRARARR